jgi:nucleoside-diphosphate-sugar epimerase
MAIYLVTGAAGFIGSSIVRELLARGERVRALDNFETGKPENIQDLVHDIDFREINILDYSNLVWACEGADFVLHQAALPSVPLSVAEPERSHRININGTFNVLLAAQQTGVRRVVYAASSSAYGETLVLPKQENMSPDPISPYAVQKLTGELYMRCFARVYGVETVCLRYFNIFGPRQDPGSPYSGVLARFITAMLNWHAPTVFGDGEQTRDFTYVDNAVAANLLAAVAPARQVVGQSFNIGTGQRISLNLVVELLREITGYAGPVNYAPARNGDVKHSQADISKACAAMNYSPEVTFKEGLKRTVEWYKSQTVPTPVCL